MDATSRRKLRAAEAAAYVRLSPSTLSKKRLTGDGPAYAKIGRIVIYDVEDLESWLRERVRQSTSDEPHIKTCSRT